MTVIEVGKRGESPKVSITPSLLIDPGQEILVLEWETVVLRISHLGLTGIDLLGAIIRAQATTPSKHTE